MQKREPAIRAAFAPRMSEASLPCVLVAGEKDPIRALCTVGASRQPSRGTH
jgi:hypothetical protein